jgi:hypothetical protein
VRKDRVIKMTFFDRIRNKDQKFSTYKCQNCDTVYYKDLMFYRNCKAKEEFIVPVNRDKVNLGGVCRLLALKRVKGFPKEISRKYCFHGNVEYGKDLRKTFENHQLGMYKAPVGIVSADRKEKPVTIIEFCLKKILGRYGGKT